MNIDLSPLVPKKIRLPNSLRVISEMHADENFVSWLIIISHLQIIARSIMKNNTSALYVNRIKLLCTWIRNEAPPEWAVTRSHLSNWEAFTSVLGPIVRAGISVKKIVIRGVTNMVAPDPVSFSYTHKFAGSSVATSLIAGTFISTHVYADLSGFRAGLEPVIEQIHTVQRTPDPVLSKFPNAQEVFEGVTDATLARRINEVMRLIPESDIITMDDFHSLVVAVNNSMKTTR